MNFRFVRQYLSALFLIFILAGVTALGASLPAPTLAPTKGYSTFHPHETVTFNWSAVPGAASYILQFSTDPNFPVLTRGQFDNIPNTTFTFTTADQGFYSARVLAVDANRVVGAPSNVITYSVSYNNPLPPPPVPLSPGNGASITLPLTFTWTDVPNPQPSGYELQIGRDASFSSIEDDIPQINSALRTELSLTPGTKYWRVRSIQGDSSPTTPALTAWSKVGSFTVSAAPAAPVSMALASNPFYSGDSTWVALQLSAAAPAGGAIIALSSSDPVAAPVPATVVMPGNTAWTQFLIQAGQVTTPTLVTFTAKLNSGSASIQFTVQPPSLKSLTIAPSAINGGAQPQAILLLNGQAPASGAAVSFFSTSPAVLAPASALVAGGSSSVSFPLATLPVSATTTATVTASWNGITVGSQVTLTPQHQPASLTLNPAVTSGTTGSFATVLMASPSSTGDLFQVSSSNPAVASVPGGVSIPQGSTSGGFSIITSSVSTPTSVTISVSGGGVTRSAVLTVNPSSPSPTPTPTPSSTATLTVFASGRSGERVISSPAGISVAVGTSGSGSFTTGAAITLTISNGRDAIWSGACSSGGNKAKSCTVTLAGDASVNANVQ